MDYTGSTTNIDIQIGVLAEAIDHNPNDDTLYVERGKLYHQMGQFDKAQNDFQRAAALNPANREAESYIELIQEIFNYRYKDIYNP
ncbi:MAG: tetratricopeptide repeat protein [Rikenellaceae bacterium]|jgi:nicotinate-nucleotide adenylyltransferase|nr:tetratricopeptide repeat protein [Rikenellaceae bacterium]